MGKEVKLEAGGFEAAEVGVQGGEGKSGADGEGCEVSVHPDFGRSGRDGGEFEPEITRAFGFGVEAVDVRLSKPSGEDRNGIGVGSGGYLVKSVQGGGGYEAQPGLLGGATKQGGLSSATGCNECLGGEKKLVFIKERRHPNAGINESSRHGSELPLRWLVRSRPRIPRG